MLLLLFVSFAVATQQISAFVSGGTPVDQFNFAVLDPASGTLKIGAPLDFGETFTVNSCGAVNSATYSCVTSSSNLTTWSSSGKVLSSFSMGFVYPQGDGNGQAAVVASFGANSFGVVALPGGNISNLMLFEEPAGKKTMLDSVEYSLGPVNFAAASPNRIWFGLGNTTIDTHWRQTAHDIVGYALDGSSPAYHVKTDGATWNDCHWDTSKSQLLCLSKVNQANGPTTLSAISEQDGSRAVVCSTISGLPDVFYPENNVYDSEKGLFYSFGYMQVDNVPSKFFVIDATCNAKEVPINFPSGYDSLTEIFILEV